MKQSKTNERRRAFLAAIEAAGIDTNTDFLALSFDEIATLARLAKDFNYRKSASFPGSTARAFYYSALIIKLFP